jgi:hypothetical protein
MKMVGARLMACVTTKSILATGSKAGRYQPQDTISAWAASFTTNEIQHDTCFYQLGALSWIQAGAGLRQS